jgi:hypothetical protein
MFRRGWFEGTMTGLIVLTMAGVPTAEYETAPSGPSALMIEADKNAHVLLSQPATLIALATSLIAPGAPEPTHQPYLSQDKM